MIDGEQQAERRPTLKRKTWLGVAGMTTMLLVSGTAAGQEMSAEEIAMFDKYAMPGENHRLMEPMIGEWEETVVMWFAPEAPPVTMEASMTAEWILDGRWVRSEHRGTMMGQPFHGIGLDGYDSYREEYISIWMDNMSTASMVSRGTHDPATNAVTLMGTADDFMASREDVPVRSVTHWTDPDTFVFEMYTESEDGTEYQVMELTARRVTPADATE
jgi:hypothetical protein